VSGFTTSYVCPFNPWFFTKGSFPRQKATSNLRRSPVLYARIPFSSSERGIGFPRPIRRPSFLLKSLPSTYSHPSSYATTCQLPPLNNNIISHSLKTPPSHKPHQITLPPPYPPPLHPVVFYSPPSPSHIQFIRQSPSLPPPLDVPLSTPPNLLNGGKDRSLPKCPLFRVAQTQHNSPLLPVSYS